MLSRFLQKSIGDFNKLGWQASDRFLTLRTLVEFSSKPTVSMLIVVSLPHAETLFKRGNTGLMKCV